eukprot:SAG31_NODE_4788_length_2955_cov_8.074656_3_plen_171_part_00
MLLRIRYPSDPNAAHAAGLPVRHAVPAADGGDRQIHAGQGRGRCGAGQHIPLRPGRLSRRTLTRPCSLSLSLSLSLPLSPSLSLSLSLPPSLSLSLSRLQVPESDVGRDYYWQQQVAAQQNGGLGPTGQKVGAHSGHAVAASSAWHRHARSIQHRGPSTCVRRLTAVPNN